MQHVPMRYRVRVAVVCLATAPFVTSPAIADERPAAKEVPVEPETGLAAKYPGDRGIGRDPAVLFHDDFESAGPLRARWDNVHHDRHVRFAEEPENVHAGRRAVEFTVPKQKQELSNALVKALGGGGHDVVFLRYYSRFDPGFDQLGSSHNGAMLIAISPALSYATPGVRADGRNKFAASFECWREAPDERSPGRLNVYCYHPAQRSQWGDHFFPTGTILPNSSDPHDFGPTFVPRPDVTPEPGRWYCYEMMLKANTPGRRDGRITCWVDGMRIADFPNLRLRDDESLKINHAEITLHIGSNPIGANRKWYDDVVIATQYVGPIAKEK